MQRRHQAATATSRLKRLMPTGKDIPFVDPGQEIRFLLGPLVEDDVVINRRVVPVEGRIAGHHGSITQRDRQPGYDSGLKIRRFGDIRLPIPLSARYRP